MAEYLYSYLVLLMHLLPGVASGTEIKRVFACEGETVMLFHDIAINSTFATVSLYANGNFYNEEITYTVSNNTISSEYSEKVSLDRHGILWLLHVERFDERTYLLTQRLGGTKLQHTVHLTVYEAPAKSCKPDIKHRDNFLIASLDDTNCGKPAASVHWLEHPAISNIVDNVAQLHSRDEAGTFYACSEGPALRCARNSNILDYCTAYTVPDRNYPRPSSTSENNTEGPIMMTFILILQGGLIILIIAICWYFKRTLGMQRQLQTAARPERNKNSNDKVENKELLQRTYCESTV